MNITTVVTSAMPTNQATKNETLLIRARPLNNISITAAMGIGLIAIPTAKPSVSPIAAPISWLVRL